MDKITQQQRIVNYLETHGPASNLDLSIALRISSASKRISELRQQGKIGQFQCYNRDNNGKVVSKYNRYYIRKENLNA